MYIVCTVLVYIQLSIYPLPTGVMIVIGFAYNRIGTCLYSVFPTKHIMCIV